MGKTQLEFKRPHFSAKPPVFKVLNIQAEEKGCVKIVLFEKWSHPTVCNARDA